MFSYIFSEDYSGLKSKSYLEVYQTQNLNHQDYFHHPKFQYACFSVFSKYSKCYLLSIYRINKLIGYATFRTVNLTVRKIKHQFLVPVAYDVAEYSYPIICKNYIDDFFKILNKALVNYNVYFQHVPGFFKKRILGVFNNSFIYRVVNLPILRNFDEELLRTSKKRDFIQNKKKLIKQYDNVEICHLVNGIDEKILSLFFELHINRWKEDGVDSNFNLKEYREIYIKIANLKIENIGYPILSYLKANGKFLALQFGSISNKRFNSMIRARSIDSIYRSPGSILMKEILEFISAKEIEIYSMGAGDEAYKYRYMNDIETYFTILKFKSFFSSFFSRVTLK